MSIKFIKVRRGMWHRIDKYGLRWDGSYYTHCGIRYTHLDENVQQRQRRPRTGLCRRCFQ